MLPNFYDDLALINIRRRIFDQIKNGQNLVILMGPLGSGKSRNLNLISEELSKNRIVCIKEINFAGAHAVDGALIDSTSFIRKLSIVALWIAVFIFLIPMELLEYFPNLDSNSNFINPSSAYLLILGFISFAFFANKTNTFFRFANLLPNANLIILDDLERSTLSTNEAFCIVREYSKLWRRQIIANLGYVEEKDRLAILDFAFKQGAYIEELPCIHTTNLEIAKALIPTFPFTDSPTPSFLSLFAPREILAILDMAAKSFPDSCSEKGKLAILIHMFFHATCKKVNVTKAQLANGGLHHSNKISFKVNAGASESLRLNGFQRKHLDSFAYSMTVNMRNNANSSGNVESLKDEALPASQIALIGEAEFV
jgi:hypothetical protein